MLIFLPLKDTRTQKEKIRVVFRACVINVVAALLLMLATRFVPSDRYLFGGIIMITGILNYIFCIPTDIVLTKEKDYFYPGYGLGTSWQMRSASLYHLNAVIAACLASILYGFLFRDMFVTKLILIGGISYGLFMAFVIKYLRPRAKLSSREQGFFSKLPSGHGDGNIYSTREFLITTFDTIVFLAIFSFWVVCAKFLGLKVM